MLEKTTFDNNTADGNGNNTDGLRDNTENRRVNTADNLDDNVEIDNSNNKKLKTNLISINATPIHVCREEDDVKNFSLSFHQLKY